MRGAEPAELAVRMGEGARLWWQQQRWRLHGRHGIRLRDTAVARWEPAFAAAGHVHVPAEALLSCAWPNWSVLLPSRSLETEPAR